MRMCEFILEQRRSLQPVNDVGIIELSDAIWELANS